MTDTPRENPETEADTTAATPDKAVTGDGKARPEPRSFGGANQGADPSDADYGDANGGAEIAADDAGASAMAERAANDVERP